MVWTNQQIRQIAMEQSAVDLGCRAEDFLKSEPVVVEGAIGKGARVYYKEPIGCNLVSYGNNAVASVRPELCTLVSEYLGRYPFYHLFETPNALWLHERLIPMGYKLCFMADFFLPDVERLTPLSCPYELRLLQPSDFAELYTKEWSNAILAERRELDMLAYGAYDGEALVGLAGCSADCETMWQIGVDVLPDYRRRGIAAALTSRLALEVLERGRVPFYCCAWSNIPSARNAARSGFSPAWVEMTAKPASFVDQINRIEGEETPPSS